MERIKEFAIISVEMSGFKRHKEPYSVKLDNVSYIFGGNGEGKTTIADAISYAFCGTPFWGEKSADRLQNPECSEMMVGVKFVDRNGVVHSLTRKRSGSNTVIVLDGEQVKQSDMTNLFAERDIFLSLFNPLYFVEKIAESGREFLQKLLPRVDREQVLEKLSDSTRSILENEEINEPFSYIKGKREKIREVEDEEHRIKAQIDLLKEQKRGAEKDIDDIIKMGEEFVSKKTVLEKKRYEGIDIEALKKQQAQIVENSSDERRKQLLSKQAEIQNRIYVSKYAKEGANLAAELKVIKDRLENAKKRIASLKVGDVCPYCKTAVTEGNISSIIENMKKDAAKIAEQGKNVYASFEHLKKLDSEELAKFNEAKADALKKIADGISALGSGDMADAAMLEDKIKFGNLTKEEYDELLMVEKNAADYENYVKALSEVGKNDEKIAEFEKQLAKLSEEKTELNSIVQAATSFASKKAEIMLSNLKMNRAAIKLFDVVKTTGEVKDTFRFTYDGKDYRWLSASEKVKAGLEIAKLLKRLTNLNFPLYIDNAEGITTKIEPIQGQVLLAYARNCQLTVRSPQTNAVKEAA
ncbi:MAG: AAA family ATPase [Firmicutes bacterium]|nr:AAA family ATPase [Bacillota bacterium]